MEQQRWMHRASAFELLSKSLLLPSHEIARAAVDGSFQDAVSEILKALGYGSEGRSAAGLLDEYTRMDEDEAFHRLRKQYTYLFVGERGPRITPYLGVRDAQVNGVKELLFLSNQTIAIESFMKERGVSRSLDAGRANNPIDHIGTVCEFMEYLCLVNARAIKASDGFVVTESDFNEFYDSYFRAYAQWLSAELGDSARDCFYRVVSVVLECVTDSCRLETVSA